MRLETILKLIAGIVYASGGTVDNLTYTHFQPRTKEPAANGT